MDGINWDSRGYSKKEFTDIWLSSDTISSVITKLGFNNRSSGSYKSIKKAAESLGLDTNHMSGRAHGTSGIKSDEEFFVENSSSRSVNVKERALTKGLLKNLCYICGIGPEWNSKALNLQIDHINGDPTDNRIPNLRMLCPNCHSQTETFCGKNNRKSYVSKRRKLTKCSDCGIKVYKESKKCVECTNKYRSLNIPNRETLLKDFKNNQNFSYVGRKYKVSPTTVRRWCRKYKLPDTKSSMTKYVSKIDIQGEL